MPGSYWRLFTELIVTPFHHPEMVWGIVPLYFGWLVNELTSAKPSFQTAIQTGFSFVWAAAHWSYQYRHVWDAAGGRHGLGALFAVNVLVTALIFLVGAVALVSGLRGKYPPYGAFLGHTRFSNYFMIAIFPIQSGYLEWSWDRLAVIVLSAVPVWLLVQFGLKPLRKKK